MTTRHHSRRVTFSDGNVIAYWEFGDPGGTPVMALHGMPICGLCFAPIDAAARQAGIRLLAPDRPGTGWTTPDRDHTVAGWTEDLEALVDVLGIGRFGVIGWSSGGPFGLACGALLESRLLGLTIVGGIAPIATDDALEHYAADDRALFQLARTRPEAARRQIRDIVVTTRTSRKAALEAFTAALNDADRALVDSLGDVDEAFAFFPATVNGPHGFADGVVAVSRPWGFELDEVTFPVHLFVGSSDTVVNPAITARLLAQLPRARLTSLPGEGHLLIYTHPRLILEAAISEQPAG